MLFKKKSPKQETPGVLALANDELQRVAEQPADAIVTNAALVVPADVCLTDMGPASPAQATWEAPEPEQAIGPDAGDGGDSASGAARQAIHRGLFKKREPAQAQTLSAQEPPPPAEVVSEDVQLVQPEVIAALTAAPKLVGEAAGTMADSITETTAVSATTAKANETARALSSHVSVPAAPEVEAKPLHDRTLRSHPSTGESPATIPGAAQLPAPYFLATDGSLCRRAENGDHVQITLQGPIWPVSIMRTIDGNGWSLEVCYRDADGKLHIATFSLSEVLGGKASMVARLADTGLQILPDKVSELIDFLQACRPEQRVIVTTQAGWLGHDHQVFVTPNAIIGDTGNEKVVLRQEVNSPTRNSVHGAGTLGGWQEIALLARKYPLALFVLLAAFTGPLLKLLRLDGGGFHFFGASSRGKTTLLQIAASVWGKGSDPTRDSRSFVQRWLLTVNALEALASCHSDTLICLDELGSFSSGDLGQIVYMVAGGSGKAVMNSHRQLKQTRSWSGNILSSGEKTIAEAILEGGKGLKAGHLVRIIDIPAGDSFSGGEGEDSAVVVNSFKELCASVFGTAGPTYVEKLIATIEENPDYVDEIRGEFDATVRALTPGNASPEQGRAIRKFAAVEIAGKLAVRFGVLPFKSEEIRWAVTTVRDMYLSYSSSVPDSHRGMIQLREFLVRNHASLPAVSDPKAKGGGVKGFRSGNGQYLFTEEQLGAASGVGASGVQELAKNLKAKGFLATNEPGRMKSKFKLASAGGQFVRFYSVKGTLLEADLGGEEAAPSQADPPREETMTAPGQQFDGDDVVVSSKKKLSPFMRLSPKPVSASPGETVMTASDDGFRNDDDAKGDVPHADEDSTTAPDSSYVPQRVGPGIFKHRCPRPVSTQIFTSAEEPEEDYY